MTVAAMPKVTEDLPRQRASSVKQLPHIRELQLADPHFDIPGPIDLLLSVDVFNDILLPQKINGPKETPTAWNTELGWGIMEKYIPDHPSELTSSSVCVVSVTTAEDSLSDVQTKFWQVEEPAKPVSPLTTEELRIQKHYSDTYQFSPTAGRYIVSIPRRNTSLQLGESRSKALRKMRHLPSERELGLSFNLWSKNILPWDMLNWSPT